MPKPTGRPKLAPDERRDERLSGLRLTVAERVFVEEQAAAAGLGVSEYARRRLLGHTVAPARTVADDRLLMELNAIGNLLNQIARALHTDRPERADLSAALDEWRHIAAALAARV